MTFFQIFFRYILPASMLNWLFWLAIYRFNLDIFPLRELIVGFSVAFASVVGHIALAMWAFSKNNVLFMALVMGSLPLRLLLVFAEVAFTLNSADIHQGVFVSGLLVFYLTYLHLEIYLFAKSANTKAKRDIK